MRSRLWPSASWAAKPNKAAAGRFQPDLSRPIGENHGVAGPIENLFGEGRFLFHRVV
jgi:hypothetical protein